MYFSYMMLLSVSAADAIDALPSRVRTLLKAVAAVVLSDVWNAASAMMSCVSSYVMTGCEKLTLLVRAEPAMGETCATGGVAVATSYPTYVPLPFLPKYSDSRESPVAVMMSTSGLPATRSLPNDETWNCAHMLRSDVALEFFVFQSF